MLKLLGVFVLCLVAHGSPARADIESTYVYSFLWGGQGSAPGQFIGVQGMDFDSSETLYVCDESNHRVQMFDTTGTPLGSFGGWGTALGKLKQPYDVCFDAAGNIYVAEKGNHRVSKFTPGGTPILTWGVQGSGAGEFEAPWGIACDEAGGFIYVTEQNGHRVQKFDLNGNFVLGWGALGGTPGLFDMPRGIDIAADGTIWVASAVDARIQHFDIDGAYLGEFGGVFGSGEGQFHHANFLRIRDDGTIQISDWWIKGHGFRLQQFMSTGTYICEFIVPVGAAPGEADHGGGFAFASNGDLYISDSKNHRVQVFSVLALAASEIELEERSWGNVKAMFREGGRR